MASLKLTTQFNAIVAITSKIGWRNGSMSLEKLGDIFDDLSIELVIDVLNALYDIWAF
jgi:hypothetical protein